MSRVQESLLRGSYTVEALCLEFHCGRIQMLKAEDHCLFHCACIQLNTGFHFDREVFGESFDLVMVGFLRGSKSFNLAAVVDRLLTLLRGWPR